MVLKQKLKYSWRAQGVGLQLECRLTYSMVAIFHGAPHLKVLLTEVQTTSKTLQLCFYCSSEHSARSIHAASLRESVADTRIPAAFVKG